MKRFDVFDERLIAARPNDITQHEEFTQRVMTKVHAESEIFSRVVRTTSTDQRRKETWIMRKIHAMPIGLVIAAIIAGVIAIGGVSYAAYELWLKPSVEVSQSHENTGKRLEVTAELQHCATQQGKVTYELKKTAKITEKDIPMVVQAHCELEAIQQWAEQYTGMTMSGTAMLNTGLARKISMVSSKQVILASNEAQGFGEEKFDITSGLVLVADRQAATIDRFKPGDTVIAVTYDTYKPEGGMPTSRTLKALVKLSLPYEMYDPLKYQSLTELIPCPGNEADKCTEGGSSIDVYSNFNVTADAHKLRNIDGVIVSMTPSRVEIKGTSGAIYTLQLDRDVLNDFNTKRSHDYQGTTIRVGDTLSLRYFAEKNDTNRTIAQAQIQTMTLATELVSKRDSIQKY